MLRRLAHPCHHRPHGTRAVALAVAGLALLLTAATSGAAAPAVPGPGAAPRTPSAAAPTTVVPDTPGSATPLSGYAVQSTAKVTDTAEAVSSPGYPATGWYPAGPRSTVLAALLAAGLYPDPFHSTGQKLIPTADFTVPWWYRSDLTLTDTTARTHLDLSGVISAADIYL
ncbi:glycosyl hydrolase 2 galactose-binding domain-containing protein [Streptomyces sp. NPDC090021]|uniref:glycosyl hydrolase 2 galactose-binding domain-containing protein n=1 Tax=Streptomyces sp. NPDC090021 TaxID=3365919 RepID=UPI00382A564F